MSENISIQQKIQQYRQLNPNLTDLSDEQILSIMSKNGEISLTKEQKISLYSSKMNASNNHSGVEIEKQTDTKTIILHSGEKIVISSGINKYYSADGKELNQKDFEQQVGIIDVRNSGRYSLTKDGKTRYYAFNGTELNEAYFKQVENNDVIVAASDGKHYNFNKTLEKRINNVSTNLKKAEDENGFIGSTWSGFKNLTGIGDSSDNVREQQKIEKKLLEQFDTNEQTRAKVFKELTGADYSQENLEKFIKGTIKLKSEQALNAYKEGQAMAVDVGADIVSGVAAVGIYTAAVAAAPFTGGGSIAVGIAAAGASGAAIKTGMKAADAATGGREYSLKDAAYDAATGTFSGVIAPVTGGLGGAVGKTVATKLGVQAVKQVGKEVAESAVESGVKQTIKTALTNPTGYEYIGGNIAKKTLALGAEMATDGAVGGSADNAFRIAIDGGSIEDIAKAAGKGFVGGAILSPLIGGGMKSVGKGAQKIFGKDNAHIDANGNEIKQNGSDNIRQLSREELKQKLKAANKLEPNSKEIHIPKSKMAAPSAKFAETDEAFRNIIKNNERELLELHFKYQRTGDKISFIKDIYKLFVNAMDLDGIAPKLEIITDAKYEGGFLAREGKIQVNLNRQLTEKDIVDTVGHELNHFLQFKEMILTSNDGVEIFAHNNAVGYFNDNMDLLNELPQDDVNTVFSQYVQETITKVNNLYSGLLQDNRYSRNINPADSYFQKANKYFEGEADYASEGDAYLNNIQEIESFTRGSIVGDAYKDLVSNNTKTQEIVNKVYNQLIELNSSISDADLEFLLADAIATSRQPEFVNYSVDDFVTYFFGNF